MLKRTIRLEQIAIPKPCNNSWNQMTGDDKTRFCTECNSSVFNLSAMTKKQAEALLTEKQGQLCARITLRSDGTIKTTDSLNSSPPRSAMKFAGATMFALISFSTLANAQTRATPNTPIAVSAPQIADSSANNNTEAIDRSAQIYGVVYDPTGAVVAKADITVTNENNGDKYQVVADENGNYYIPNLEPGIYTVEVSATYFEHFLRKSIVLAPNNSLRFEAKLAVAATTEVIEVNSHSELEEEANVGTLYCYKESAPKRAIKAIKRSYGAFKKFLSLGMK